MKNKKIVIAGGSGFIGQEMARFWAPGNSITILGRQQSSSVNNRNKYDSLPAELVDRIKWVRWDARTPGEWTKSLDDADLVINLAGRSVNCRYTKRNKKEILESRLDATRAIGLAINECNRPPKLWINSSSATIYRHAPARPQDEYATEFQDGFSEQVCKQWEKTFFEQVTPSTRKVALRLAITLGTGGVLIPYFNLVKFWLGGKQGNGQQMFSWVHVEDTCRMIEWIVLHEELQGAFNCCSPNPVTNNVFMSTLREVTGHKFGLPAFEWMLRFGALLIGTETELVLKSRWVVPTRILESGFTFKYPHLRDAFEEVVKKVPRRQYQLF